MFMVQWKYKKIGITDLSGQVSIFLLFLWMYLFIFFIYSTHFLNTLGNLNFIAGYFSNLLIYYRVQKMLWCIRIRFFLQFRHLNIDHMLMLRDDFSYVFEVIIDFFFLHKPMKWKIQTTKTVSWHIHKYFMDRCNTICCNYLLFE